MGVCCATGWDFISCLCWLRRGVGLASPLFYVVVYGTAHRCARVVEDVIAVVDVSRSSSAFQSNLNIRILEGSEVSLTRTICRIQCIVRLAARCRLQVVHLAGAITHDCEGHTAKCSAESVRHLCFLCRYSRPSCRLMNPSQDSETMVPAKL